MIKRRNVVHNVNIDNDDIINTETSNQEQKQKLLDEIAILKASISKLEDTIYTFKFGQLQLAEKPLYRKEDITCRNIPDVETKLCYDLYHFLGLRCVQCKSKLVFEICAVVSPIKNDMYAIEILIDDDVHGKLGKWILPMFIDIHEILLQYPIDNLENLRCFLKHCKHHIDCYVYRDRQFNELQNLLLGFKNARISHNIGITQIELIMSGVKDIDSNIVYNLTLDLYYKANEVRPSKLIPDVVDNEELSTTIQKRLNKYFKPFLKKNLDTAFLKISEAQGEFIWEQIVVNSDNDNIIESQNESNSEEIGLLTALSRRNNRKPKNLRNKKYDKTNSPNNEMEHSLSVDREKNEYMNETDNDFAREDEEIKHKTKKQKTIVKSRTTNKKLHSNLKKSRIRPAIVEEKNDENIADVNKSVSNISNSSVDCILDKKRFKKFKAHIRTVKDKRTLLDDNNYSLEVINNMPKRKSPRKLTNKSQKKIKRPRQELIDEYNNNTARESLVNIEQMRKKRRTVTWDDENGKHAILHHNDNESMKLINSTPLSKKLPDKRKFFNVSCISEILSLEKTNRK